MYALVTGLRYGAQAYHRVMQDVLSGIRVIDLTSIILGPFGTSILGDLGADVIKVEPPGGDLFRAAQPARNSGMGAGFITMNRNKRSICLDLKQPEGLAVLHRLVADADVVTSNMRRAAAGRLGVDGDALRAHNPDLIYCVANGYGANGPFADEPAYDDVMQARIGLSSLLTDADGAPGLAPTVLADKVTGLYLVQAVLAALVARERTGTAHTVEVPMFETMTSFLLAEHLSGAAFVPPLGTPGYNRLMTENRKPHRTADGYLVVLPYTTRHWQRFFELAGRPDLASADWVLDPDTRSGRAHELYGLIGECLMGRTSEEWLRHLAEAEIPASAVNSLDDVIDDPHLEAVDFWQLVKHPTEGTIRTMRSPLRFDGAHGSADRPAPTLGADTIDVLSEAGYSGDEIWSLLDRGVAHEG